MSVVLEIVNILFWFVVILIPLVVIHEFGHLIMARLNGVKVIEFGVGIPPRVAYKKWKGIIWSLNWVLLGGFAKIYGDHDALDEAKEQSKINPELAKEQYVENRLAELVYNKELQFFLEDNKLKYDKSWREFDNDKFLSTDDMNFSEGKLKTYQAKQKKLETLIEWEFENKLDTPEAFFNKNVFQQTLILLGGILFNLGTAFTIFILFYGVIGSPLTFVPIGMDGEVKETYNVEYQSDNVQILQLEQDGAAYEAGIRPGDYLISISGTEISEVRDFDEFKAVLDGVRGEDVPVEYIRNSSGEKKTGTLTLTEDGDTAKFGVSNLAIGTPAVLRSQNFVDAIGISFVETGVILRENFAVLGRILMSPFNGDSDAVSQVGGPVLVGKLGNQIYDVQGVKGILNAMAFISVSLAAFNLLPLPALDGGRLIIIYLNKIIGKRNKKLEGTVITATMLVLLSLGVLIAFKDIQTISLGLLN